MNHEEIPGLTPSPITNTRYVPIRLSEFQVSLDSGSKLDGRSRRGAGRRAGILEPHSQPSTCRKPKICGQLFGLG
jgi:hypothetical protein